MLPEIKEFYISIYISFERVRLRVFFCGLANFGISLAFERNYFKYSDNSEKLAQLLYSSLVFVSFDFIFDFI